MTRRERLEAKLEKRREWAGKADARSDAAMEAEHAIGDRIPFGQPILVGHHSERRARRDQERMRSLATKSVEEAKLAEHHRDAADGIERALANSIFSDDEDAVEALRAKVARLEAERDRMKAENAAFRKEHKAELAEMSPYDRHQAMPYASFTLSNLGARIREAKQRADRLEREAELREKGVRAGGRMMTSRYAGECANCHGPIERGETIIWYRTTREAVHHKCPEPELAVVECEIHGEYDARLGSCPECSMEGGEG